jgi:AcrR family transcriptional regulator
MNARAAAAAATGERIQDAAVQVFWEAPTDQASLDEVTRRAGVSVQTVIRPSAAGKATDGSGRGP